MKKVLVLDPEIKKRRNHINKLNFVQRSEVSQGETKKKEIHNRLSCGDEERSAKAELITCQHVSSEKCCRLTCLRMLAVFLSAALLSADKHITLSRFFHN